MKITGSDKIECHIVTVEGGEWEVYTRYGANSWCVRMGESDEPCYGDEVVKLEKLFQDFLTSNANERGTTMSDAAKEFAKWAIRASWEGGDLSGGDIQDKAEKLGLLVEVAYDPDKHGPNDCDVEPGDAWYIFAPELSETANSKRG